jgi:flagellar motor switch protein FliG
MMNSPAAMNLVRLSPEAAQRILSELPEYVQKALIKRAAEIEYPVEAVVEMAFASFLDEESLSFEDCLLAERLSTSAS